MTIRNTLAAAAAVAIAVVAGSTSFAGNFVAMPASNGGASINCSVPNNVVCTISSAKGVKSVKISANGPYGAFDLVNKSYRNCPRQVKVSWDSAYQESGTKIVECAPGAFKAAH
ncbi:hypothetical protein EJC49_05815 [Aquibium carbonis]|uniref:Uncharacterized protein n=1 Tax=Aquibium carbonis TaxID=2495581 RepID=A0A3R9Y9P1_9HYPH|nr:hypothetical protein [Aquibium carbonis]RST87319.1 hypothetical protein EJC49_05815 [Aquibium carbonis]